MKVQHVIFLDPEKYKANKKIECHFAIFFVFLADRSSDSRDYQILKSNGIEEGGKICK
jgi:hypothetical protein